MLRKRRWAVATVAALLGAAGCSSAAPRAARPMGDAAFTAVDVVARVGSFQHPLDATPSPDGATIYFVSIGDDGPGVFSVPASGGAVTTIAVGDPLVRPSSVAIATDGSRLFVGDVRAGSAEAPGAILTMPAAAADRPGPAAAADTPGPARGDAKRPSVLPGTEGRAVRGLDVVHRDGGDVIYFTGIDPAGGGSGLFRVAASGGAVSTVAAGPPFASLDSVVVSAAGVSYVSDRGPAPGQGAIFRIDAGTVAPVLSGVRLGAPAGVTLIDGDATLLVSSEDGTTQADQVLFVDLATGKQAVASAVIGANKASSGGLHRAFNAPVLAWADSNGQVFRVRLR